YSYGAGRIRFDLTGVDFGTADVRTEVELGAGDLEITVPPTVDVDVALDLGVGDATLFDSHASGLGVSRSRDDTGADGTGGGTLRGAQPDPRRPVRPAQGLVEHVHPGARELRHRVQVDGQLPGAGAPGLPDLRLEDVGGAHVHGAANCEHALGGELGREAPL